MDRNCSLPALQSGDRLGIDDYMERYEATPPNVRAELISGVVYLASPVHFPHAPLHARLMSWLGLYDFRTPGCEPIVGPTLILGPEDAPEPDGALRLLPEAGGRSKLVRDKILSGPVELVAEVADSSAAIDLHDKKAAYLEGGVREYTVVAVQTDEVIWFARRGRRWKPLAPGRDGILKSRVFPGLWLDPRALLDRDRVRLERVARAGHRSAEHGRFVRELEKRMRRG